MHLYQKMPLEEVGKKNERAEKSKNHHRDLQKIIKKLNHDLKKSKPHFSHIDPLFRLRVKNLAFCLLFKNPLKPHQTNHTPSLKSPSRPPKLIKAVAGTPLLCIFALSITLVQPLFTQTYHRKSPRNINFDPFKNLAHPPPYQISPTSSI